MPTNGGVITRKDIITDEALQFGEVYATEVQKAIKANDQLVSSALELSKVVNSYRKAENQQQFLDAKQAEILISQKAISAIKEEQAALLSAEKVKQEALRTRKLNIDAETKEQKAKQGTIKLTIEERVQNEINNKILKQEALERLGLVSAYTKLNKARTDAKNTLRDLIASETASAKEIKQAQRDFDLLAAKVKKADDAVNDFTKNVGNYPLKNLASGLQNLIGAFGVTGGIAAFAGILKGAYETVKKFEQGIADLSAITGASGKNLEFLKNSAIELGKSTKGGAIAVVEAYKLIASAKPELLENVQALNQVTEATITLAKAAGMEIPEAATALTDAMNQFGVDASQASVFVDALANGAKYGAAEIPQITEALLKFGAVARSSNISIKESTALIELLAENGLKGADAGTALRNVLLKISAPDALPKKAREEMERLGISFDMLKDKTIPIADKLEKLKPLLKDNASIVKVFGLENATAAINVLAHTDRLKELTSKMGEVGTAEEQAAIRMNTLQGKTDQLSSTYDSLVLSIGKGSGVVSNFFKFFVDGATDALNGLLRLNSSWDELFDKAKDDGAKNGAKLFNERFNALIGDKMSDEQRQKIRSRLKEINDEIAKGNKDTNLKTEKSDLLRMMGTGSELEVSKSIADAAHRDAVMYANELAKVNKKIKEQGDSVYGLNFGESPKSLKKKKEDLIKALAEQNAIVEENNKKVYASRIKVNPTIAPPIEDGSPNEDKDAEKRRKAAEKALKDSIDIEKRKNDAEYELKKQRLEQNIRFNEEIVVDDTHASDMRIQALYNSQQKQEDLLLLTKNHILEEDRSKEKELLLNDNLSAKDRENIKKEYHLKSVKAEEDYSEKVIEIDQKTAKTVLKIKKDEVDKLNAEFNKKIENLKHFESEQNLIAENEIIGLQKKFREGKIKQEEYEKEVERIKSEAAVRGLKNEISNLETELTKLADTEEKKAAVKQTFHDLSVKLSDEETKNFIKNEEAKEKAAKEKEERRNKTIAEFSKAISGIFKSDASLLESLLKNVFENLDKITKGGKLSLQDYEKTASSALSVVSDVAGAMSRQKIQNIDDEIQKSDEYYANEIAKAGNDVRKKAILEKEQEKKRQELEKKKREEQHKQAVFQKVMTIAQIGLQTALAVITAAAATAPTFWGVAIAAAIGAIEIAAAIATPIPKYKDGRKGGKAEIAMINDGGIKEVVEDKFGRAKIYGNYNQIVKLDEGDTVHRSIEDYHRSIKSSIVNGVGVQSEKMNTYQQQVINDIYSKEIVEELKKIRNQKQTIVFNAPKVDIQHAVWAMNNKNWNN